MSESIAIGDVVELNSGGPPMTVNNLNQREVVCVWISDGEVRQWTFNKASVRICRPQPAPSGPSSPPRKNPGFNL